MQKKLGKKRTFPREFKMSIVQMLNEGKSATELSREIDVHENQLYAWKKKYEKDGEKGFVGRGNLTDEAILRRRVKRLEMENEILKKAVSIFSKDAVTEWSSSNPFVARTRS